MTHNNLTKILLSTFIVIFAGATFVSCNDDDKDKKRESGTWLAYVQDSQCKYNDNDPIPVVQLKFEGDSLFASVIEGHLSPCLFIGFSIEKDFAYKYKISNDTLFVWQNDVTYGDTVFAAHYEPFAKISFVNDNIIKYVSLIYLEVDMNPGFEIYEYTFNRKEN